MRWVLGFFIWSKEGGVWFGGVFVMTTCRRESEKKKRLGRRGFLNNGCGI